MGYRQCLCQVTLVTRPWRPSWCLLAMVHILEFLWIWRENDGRNEKMVLVYVLALCCHTLDVSYFSSLHFWNSCCFCWHYCPVWAGEVTAFSPKGSYFQTLSSQTKEDNILETHLLLKVCWHSNMRWDTHPYKLKRQCFCGRWQQLCPCV